MGLICKWNAQIRVHFQTHPLKDYREKFFAEKFYFILSIFGCETEALREGSQTHVIFSSISVVSDLKWRYIQQLKCASIKLHKMQQNFILLFPNFHILKLLRFNQSRLHNIGISVFLMSKKPFFVLFLPLLWGSDENSCKSAKDIYVNSVISELCVCLL